MIKVKVSIPNTTPPIIRQTPNSSAKWGDCVFYINSDIEECDYWFVIDELDDKETAVCFPKNLVLITGEPPYVKLYPHKYLNQFGTLLTCQRNILKRKNADCSSPALPWMVGAQLKKLPAEWDQENYLDYNFFNEEHLQDRKDKLVIITSNKAMTKGHRNRLDFVMGLKERIPDYIDTFGVGFNKIEDKFDVLSLYKYSLVMENCRYPDYWTEKLSDAYLSSTFPFYSGCPNIDSYFPQKAFETLDLNDINVAATKVASAIESNLYSDRRSDIALAKKMVLDKYNMFAMMSDYILNDKNKCTLQSKQNCTLEPLHRTFGTRVRSRFLKYTGWEI